MDPETAGKQRGGEGGLGAEAQRPPLRSAVRVSAKYWPKLSPWPAEDAAARRAGDARRAGG